LRAIDCFAMRSTARPADPAKKICRRHVGSAPPRSSSGHDWATDCDVEPGNS
jgi:hypothetical protein